jgi:hypothetical protein
MIINFVYDVIVGRDVISNGIVIPKYNNIFDNNLKNISNDITELSRPSYLYAWGDTTEIPVGNLFNLREEDLYLYPINTGGDLETFLSLDDTENNTAFNCVSSKMKELLKKNKNLFIYLEHAGEPYFDSDTLKRIYDLCILNKIPFEKLIIVNGSNSNKFTLSDFQEKYGIKNTCKLWGYNWALPFKALELRSILGMEPNPQAMTSTIADISHIYLDKTKKFLFLNRRLRLHRLILLSLMFDSNIIKECMSSFDMSMNMYGEFTNMLLERSQLEGFVIPHDDKTKIVNGFNKLLEKDKATLDFEDFTSVHGFGMETKELYEQTFVSIVTETEFSQYQQSFTEKVIKPIQHNQPFILLGSPFILDKLKSYGFKTFDKWWDESYDLELDDWLRLKKVYKTIQSINKKTPAELKTIIIEMKDILEHNRNLLITMDSGWIRTHLKKTIPSIFEKQSITIL